MIFRRGDTSATRPYIRKDPNHLGAHFLLSPFDVNPVKFLKYLRDLNLTPIESLFKGEIHQTFKRVTRVLNRYVLTLHP